MAEQMLDSLDEEMMDLPYFRRVRKAREEGLEQGLRHSITNVLMARFSPATDFQERFSRYLKTQQGLEALNHLLVTVSQADNLDTLEALVSC